MPLLGYDVVGSKLVVNEDEAARVRAIFALYLEHEALLPVVQELEQRGWVNKRWQTRKGHERGGKPFIKTSLYRMLTNPAYIGKVRYKTEHHTGEHQAIIDADTWQRVQTLLQRNGRTGGSHVRNQFGALLKGLLRCVPCGCAMTPAHCTKNHTKRYRYYCCTGAQKRGWNSCPSKSIPAGQIEQFVVEQIRCIGRDRTLLNEVLTQARAQGQARVRDLEAEQRGLERELGRWHDDMRELVQQMLPGGDSGVLARLADLQERIRRAEQRTAAIRNELAGLQHDSLDEAAIAQALADFDPIWETLAPREQTRLVQLLVERVDYDGSQGKVAITFYPTGIATLAQELADLPKEPNR
jgi:site-specific DNA recombinase